MMWKPSPDIDQEVRRWMKAKGWEVSRTKTMTSNREGFLRWRHQANPPEELRSSLAGVWRLTSFKDYDDPTITPW
jgi:hypothetical protein